MNNCAVCGQPMKFVPAGFSKKTNKPYNAFYACADPAHKQPRQAPTPAQQFNQKLDEEIHEQKIQKAVAEKRESIRWMNALNNSALLIAHNPIPNSTDQDLVNRLYMLALRIDALEPNASQTHKTALNSRVLSENDKQAIPPTTRVLTQNNEEINLSDIPF